MLPPYSSSLVSSSHSYDETITNRHPRNDALAVLSPPSVVLQKGGRGNAVAKARCLSLVHARAENREHSLHEAEDGSIKAMFSSRARSQSSAVYRGTFIHSFTFFFLTQ